MKWTRTTNNEKRGQISICLQVTFIAICITLVSSGAVAIYQKTAFDTARHNLQIDRLPLLALSQRVHFQTKALSAELLSIIKKDKAEQSQTDLDSLTEQINAIRDNIPRLQNFNTQKEKIQMLDTDLAMVEAIVWKLSSEQTLYADVARAHEFDLNGTQEINLNRSEKGDQRVPISSAGMLTDQTSAITTKRQQRKNQDEDQLNIRVYTQDSIGPLEVLYLVYNICLLPACINQLITISLPIGDFIRHLNTADSSKSHSDITNYLQEIITSHDQTTPRNLEWVKLQKDSYTWLEFQKPLFHGIVITSSNLAQEVISANRKTIQNFNTLSNWLLTIQLLLLAVGLIIAFLSVLVEVKFSRKLAHLLSSIELIAAGKLDFVITITGKCDFFKLSKSIDTLRRKALELQESNIQLQRFSYVAAHDLKSPLNAIQILATWIDDDEKNILTEQSRQHLQLLQTRITRLNRLLSDLLDYACVDKAVPLPCMLNISQIVRDQGKLTSPLGDFTVEYTGITEPVFLPLTIVEQCIANLISNAVKHHDRPFGKIGVNAEIAMNELMIEVLDDGPGIPPEYQNRIFKIFETLRPRGEIEGSGVGLAVVKRLVEIANGRIDMVSDPTIERGTRFRIFFPIC